MLKSLCEAMGNRILDFCAASGKLTLLLVGAGGGVGSADAAAVGDAATSEGCQR